MTSKGYWDGQFCIVTGAASGIGLATSKLLSSNGATVLGLDRSDNAGASANVFAEGNNLYRKCDLSVPAEIEKVFAEFKTSKLAALFNVAGLPTNGLGIEETSVSDWDRIINVNLRAVFLTAKYSLPLFKNNGGGAIVNVSSVHAYSTMKNHAAYAASKGGMNSLTTELAIELNPQSIRVVGVAPGSIRTPMTTTDLKRDSELLNSLGFPTDGKSIGHVGEPEEIARVLTWCASPEASFITGTTIQADGGLLSRLGYEKGN
jgi:NAD(P)-dependent dehydrogenase (short-subunit alcohol dehydrogenase family)